MSGESVALPEKVVFWWTMEAPLSRNKNKHSKDIGQSH
jgi:hypothetical protein